MKANHTARPFGVLLLIGSVAAAFAPAGALAQQRAGGAGWYSGLSVGGSQIGMSNDILPITPATTPSSLTKDESSTGFKLFAGYRYNQNFALEGGYTDLGKFEARRDATAPVGSISRNMRTSGFDLAAVGIIPMQSGFSLFGKIGAMYTMTRSSISTSGALLPLPTTDLSPKRSEWNPKVGLGAGYDFSNGLGLRVEYERVSNVGDARTGDGNIGMWSLGLTKRY